MVSESWSRIYERKLSWKWLKNSMEGRPIGDIQGRSWSEKAPRKHKRRWRNYYKERNMRLKDKKWGNQKFIQNWGLPEFYEREHSKKEKSNNKSKQRSKIKKNKRNMMREEETKGRNAREQQLLNILNQEPEERNKDTSIWRYKNKSHTIEKKQTSANYNKKRTMIYLISYSEQKFSFCNRATWYIFRLTTEVQMVWRKEYWKSMGAFTYLFWLVAALYYGSLHI